MEGKKASNIPQPPLSNNGNTDTHLSVSHLSLVIKTNLTTVIKPNAYSLMGSWMCLYSFKLSLRIEDRKDKSDDYYGSNFVFYILQLHVCEVN